jgi:hypothetical protein
MNKFSIFTIFGCLFLFGCTSTPWKTLDQQTPLAGPNEPLVAKYRHVSNLTDIAMPSPRSQHAWEKPNGQKINPASVIRSVDSYLKKTGLLDSFKSSRSNIDGYQQKVANHRMCIISVEPTIVLMIPHDFGRVDRSTYEIRGNTVGWGHMEYSNYMLDGIYTGTDFPYTQGVKWFNPRSRKEPSLLEQIQNNDFEIISESALIKLIVKDGRIYAEREK